MENQRVICTDEYQTEFCLMNGDIISSIDCDDAIQFRKYIKTNDQYSSWKYFLILKIKLRCPFIIEENTEVLYGSLVVSFGYYFYSIKVGLIDVDESKYINEARRRLDELNTNASRLASFIN